MSGWQYVLKFPRLHFMAGQLASAARGKNTMGYTLWWAPEKELANTAAKYGESLTQTQSVLQLCWGYTYDWIPAHRLKGLCKLIRWLSYWPAKAWIHTLFSLNINTHTEHTWLTGWDDFFVNQVCRAYYRLILAGMFKDTLPGASIPGLSRDCNIPGLACNRHCTTGQCSKTHQAAEWSLLYVISPW